ncbi:hypothetical protein ACFYY3_06610 [Streptomyces sp. NPDC001812]|uniref:hypothetical protein n=1 Tax=Streptomyces sp. NPDC001812 TaxID=3364611 RepID=UPI0036BB0043
MRRALGVDERGRGLAGRLGDHMAGVENGGRLGDGCLRALDEATGSDLVSFCTGGDGTWPVWLRRSAAGELVSVVIITSYL